MIVNKNILGASLKDKYSILKEDYKMSITYFLRLYVCVVTDGLAELAACSQCITVIMGVSVPSVRLS